MCSPVTNTMKSLTNSLSIAELLPAIQQQFSLAIFAMPLHLHKKWFSLILSPTANCHNSNVLTSMLLSRFNAATLTFIQAANVPLYQVTSQHPATPTYLLPTVGTSTMPVQQKNPNSY